MVIHAQPDLRIVIKEDIFQNPPFRSCHAATICSLGKQTLLAAWFGGEHEGSSDVAIWGSFRKNDGWTRPVQIADGLMPGGERFACWNPVLFLHQSGMLYLYYKIGIDPRHWHGYYKTSADQGQHWSVAKAMPDSLLGPIRNKPIQLSTGEILYPSSRESEDEKSWTSHIEISSADCLQWNRYPIPSGNFGIIQPTLLQYANGRIQALCRSRQNKVVQSWSDDRGKHWSVPEALELLNPNSGIDAVTMKNGWQLLVYNPLKAGTNWWEGRSVLKLAASKDGIHWQDVLTLEEHADGEYSYPAIIADDAQHIHIVYTAKRETIRYIELQ